jgi:hypothetical protein
MRIYRFRKYLALLLLSLGLSAASLRAQLILGAKADLGIAWMQLAPAKSESWVMQPWLGPQLGGFARFGLNKYCFVETQLSYNHVSARRRLAVSVADSNGLPTGAQIYVRAAHNLHCLSLPLYAGFRLGWADLLVGGQANAQIGSSLRYWTTSTPHGNPDGSYAIGRGLAIKPLDIGLKVALTTSLNRNWAIEASYYHGLTNVYAGSDPSSSWRVRQVTYGLRYSIHHF